MSDEYNERWNEEDEIPEELLKEYESILKELDAIERELSLILIASALGASWHLWHD